MARWGRADFEQLKRLQKKMEKLQNGDFEKFCEACSKELAARLLGKVIRRTPVGVVDGGTLRRGWTATTHAEAESGGNTNAKAYAESLVINKRGNVYEIEITNPVNYASYVEFGHRTANHKGWVKGRFMLTISEQELQSQAPKILERLVQKFLGECFDAD